jgi:hypothetical protein
MVATRDAGRADSRGLPSVSPRASWLMRGARGEVISTACSTDDASAETPHDPTRAARARRGGRPGRARGR